MVAIPAPTHEREEWNDADFDLPDDAVISPPSNNDSDEDWDIEMDFGKTGSARAPSLSQGSSAAIRSSPLSKGRSGMVTIRPTLGSMSESTSPEDGDDDEGISTIKISDFPAIPPKATESATDAEDDMESDFAIPSDLTQLSLRPRELHHQGSKASLEWGDRDHTSSSTASSDTYSSLGFHPSGSSTSASLPASEDEECNGDAEDDLDGLVIPTGLFETDVGRKHLVTILDLKKRTTTIDERSQITFPDPEDDFEIGLVINGDEDLSPSKFAQTQETKRSSSSSSRSNSMPARTSTLRPPSRLKGDRPRTPVGQSGVTSRTMSRISSSPPLRPSTSKRSNTYQGMPMPMPAPAPAPPTQGPSSFVVPKQGVIRGQKSHGVLKVQSPTSQRKMSRKASLSSLLETSSAQESASEAGPSNSAPHRGYASATASSRARVHTNSTGRVQAADVALPPSRPTTPNEPARNAAVNRLTMPTSLHRLKSRPSISGIFPSPSTPPLPPSPAGVPAQLRAGSRASTSASAPVRPSRKSKRREFGDGTELDGFDDLPTDRDKEAKFRVQPKSHSRTPTGSGPKIDKDTGRGTIRRRREAENGLQPSASSVSLKHKQSRVEGLSKTESIQKPRKVSSTSTNRKPTLIRNLGGSAAPKVVGEMRWNPQTLRWEGNDQALRDFDTSSSRPALITHYTGGSSVSGSPAGSFGPTSRVVGNMVFDPIRMCWLSTLSPDEDEPDVFADLADDEDEAEKDAKSNTIRALGNAVQLSASQSTNTDTCSDSASRKTNSPVPSSRSRAQSLSTSDSDRGSRADLVFDVEDNFAELCRAAEARHRIEIKGWTLAAATRSDSRCSFYGDDERPALYEIRTLATRQY